MRPFERGAIKMPAPIFACLNLAPKSNNREEIPYWTMFVVAAIVKSGMQGTPTRCFRWKFSGPFFLPEYFELSVTELRLIWVFRCFCTIFDQPTQMRFKSPPQACLATRNRKVNQMCIHTHRQLCAWLPSNCEQNFRVNKKICSLTNASLCLKLPSNYTR